MRFKKDNVRENILNAGKKEFFKNGYKDASMRDIAASAEITPGNIYRYFESKEELLDAIVKPTYEKVEEITKLKGKIRFDVFGRTNGFINLAINYSLDIIALYRYEIIILLNKSKGSKYQDVKEQLVEFTTTSINNTYPESNIELARVFASAAVSSVLTIMEEYLDEPDKIKVLSREFLTALFSNPMFKTIKEE